MLLVLGLLYGLSGITDIHAQSGARDTAGHAPRLMVEDLLVSEVGEDGTATGLPQVQLSPDGQWIAYTVRRPQPAKNAYDVELVLAKVRQPGASRILARRESALGQDAGALLPPRWSPDGTRLLYACERTGRLDFCIYHVRRQTADTVAVGDPWEDAGSGASGYRGDDQAEQYRWAPDGRSIAFLGTQVPRPRPQDSLPALSGREVDVSGALVDAPPAPFTVLRVLDLASRAVRTVSPDKRQVMSFDWAPDGRLVISSISSSERHRMAFMNTDLHVLELASGAVRPLVVQPGRDANPVWSPDGTMIAFRSQAGTRDFSYRSTIGVVPADGGPIRYPVPAAFRQDTAGGGSSFIWAPDSRALYYQTAYRLTRQLFELRLPAGEVRRITRGDTLTFGSFSFSRDGTQMAFVAEGVSLPQEVYVSAVATFTPRPLTRLNPAVRAHLRSTTELVAWTNQRDGWTIHGLLVRPPGFMPTRRYPLVVHLQGGPTMVEQSFNIALPGRIPIPILVLADRGYLVFVPNTRGREGYGDRFKGALAAQRSYGRNPVSDMLSGVDALVARGIVDTTRMAVTGHSYGGYLAALTLGLTQRFRAAVVHEAGFIEYPGLMFRTVFGDSLVEAFERDRSGVTSPWNPAERTRLEAESPLHQAHRVTTPTLVMAGQERGSYEQDLWFYRALRYHRVEAVMIVNPRTGHTIAEPVLQLDAMRRVLAWIDDRLAPPAVPIHCSAR